MKNYFVTFLMIILSFVLGFFINNNERYKIYMHPTYRADQYLLDTKNGHIWHLTQDKNKVLIWEPMLKFYPQEIVDENKK